MIKHIYPLGDRVLINPIDQGERRHGAILIADLGQERPELGEVIAIGEGRQSEFSDNIMKVSVKVGDIVLIPKIGTIRTEIDGEEYYLPQDKEILAIVDFEKED